MQLTFSTTSRNRDTPIRQLSSITIHHLREKASAKNRKAPKTDLLSVTAIRRTGRNRFRISSKLRFAEPAGIGSEFRQDIQQDLSCGVFVAVVDFGHGLIGIPLFGRRPSAAEPEVAAERFLRPGIPYKREDGCSPDLRMDLRDGNFPPVGEKTSPQLIRQRVRTLRSQLLD